jgi:hypothetical protein
MKEDTLKHLEFVQAVITRMGSNSFLLKGWNVTLAAGLFALAAKDSNPTFAVVALLPAVVFWGLDAYYLRQERLFRELYDDLRPGSAETQTKVEPFSMSTSKYENHVPSWFRTLWSKTIFPLHGVVAGAILIAVWVIGCSR